MKSFQRRKEGSTLIWKDEFRFKKYDKNLYQTVESRNKSSTIYCNLLPKEVILKGIWKIWGSNLKKEIEE